MTDTSSSKKPRSLEQEILELDEERKQAVIHADVLTLERIFHDDYSQITADGVIQYKTELLSWLRSGEIKYPNVHLDDYKVRFYGDTAVVTCRAQVEAELWGKEVAYQSRLTRVWVKQEGQWQLVASQGSRIAQK